MLSGVFTSCYSMKSIIFPSGLTAIPGSVCTSCTALVKAKFPAGTASIGGSAFSAASGVCYYDFSNNAAIPTLSNVSAFNSMGADCKIVVPDSLYEDWKAASNWSTYASYIVKASEI